jgi:hypothetical protein
MSLRTVVATASVLALTLASIPASADVQACLEASEKGQRSRAAGRLREARDAFLICGSEGCPAMVRHDCAQWQTEIIAMLPSVVFGAKDRQGRDLFDVTVSMDGETLLRKLDGKSVNVDPGPHTFKFEVAGSPAVVERALVKEGEKTRVITVSFNDGGSPSPSTEGVTAPPAEPDHGVPRARSGGGHTAYPWIVVGIGAATMVVGAVLVLTSPAIPSNCNATSKSCSPRPGESAADLSANRDDAGRAEAQPKDGLIVGAIGLGIVAGGLLWHFLEPTGHATASALQLTPWASPTSAGRSDHGPRARAPVTRSGGGAGTRRADRPRAR